MKERQILFSGPMVQALLAGRKTQTRRKMKSQPYTLRTEGFGYPTRAGGFVSLQSEHCLAECPYGQPGDRLWVREAWGYRGCTWHSHSPLLEQIAIEYRADSTRRSIERPDGTAQGLNKRPDATAEGVDSTSVDTWTLDAAAKTKTENLCWIETPEQSSDEDYCRQCAEKKLEEITAVRGRGDDCFVDGGWNGYEADGPRFCETCGVTLEVSYTDYAVEEELKHFKTYNGGPIGDYELNHLAAAISSEEQEREFARIGYRWLWESINGEGSWAVDPWVWAVSFRVLTPGVR